MKRLTGRAAAVARLEGILTVLVAVGLTISLPIRHVDINPLNGWTLLLCGVSGLISLVGKDRKALRGALIVLVIGLLPAVVGWTPLLFVPSLLMLVLAIRWSRDPVDVRVSTEPGKAQ